MARGPDAVAGYVDEIVVDPMAVGGDEKLVHVVVGANEVDVLAAILVDVAVEGRVGRGSVPLDRWVRSLLTHWPPGAM